MKTGAFSLFAGGASANSDLQALVEGGPLNPVPPKGSLAALERQITRVLENQDAILAVIDTGRNTVSHIKHSSAMATAVAAVLSGLSGVVVYDPIPDVTNKQTVTWDVKKNGTSILGDVSGGTQSGAFEVALANILNPKMPSRSAESIIGAVIDALDTAQKEAFILLNTQDQSIKVYIVADTSGCTAFTSSTNVNGIANGVDDTLISVSEMTPDAAATSSTSLI